MKIHATQWLSKRLMGIFSHCTSKLSKKICSYSNKRYTILETQPYSSSFIILSFSRGKSKSNPRDYHNYIKYLDYTGKLDNYLDRSISYIFMRDLGKALDSKETQARVNSVVNSLKNNLTQPKEKRENKHEILSMAWLYRWAQQESIESAVIWMINKLKTVSNNLPQGMDPNHAQRKLIKIIAGVIMHEIEEMGDKTSLMNELIDLIEPLDLAMPTG